MPTQTVEDYNAAAVTQPSFPPGTQFNPVLQVPTADEMLTAPQLNPTSTQAGTTLAQASQNVANPTAQQAATYQASQVDPNQAASMQAAQGQVSQNAQIQAQQGQLSQDTLNALDTSWIDQTQVDPKALMQNQYAELMNFGPDEVPGWAKGAMKTAMQQMAARGLGSSTMMGEAVTSALMQAALPIASQDAKVFQTMQLEKLDKKAQATFLKAGYLAQMDLQNLNNRQQAAVLNAQNFFQMDMANLENEQQAQLINTQARVQALLSNQAAENAAKQFNASSENQVNQFYDSLTKQVEMFNNAQRNEMSRFNSDQINSQERFNKQMQDAREQFNANNQILIDQANAQYLRQVNTQNTAMQNQANYINSQNLLDISNTALANQILLLRDRENYAFTHSENELNRFENRALLQLQADINKQINRDSQTQSLWQSLGSFAANVIGNIFD